MILNSKWGEFHGFIGSLICWVRELKRPRALYLRKLWCLFGFWKTFGVSCREEADISKSDTAVEKRSIIFQQQLCLPWWAMILISDHRLQWSSFLPPRRLQFHSWCPTPLLFKFNCAAEWSYMPPGRKWCFMTLDSCKSQRAKCAYMLVRRTRWQKGGRFWKGIDSHFSFPGLL